VATFVQNRGEVGSLSRPDHAAGMRGWGTDVRIVAVALVIGGAIVAGMAWNIAPLTTLGVLAAIVVALLAPPVGLALIAIMGPLQPPLVVPSPPGFNAVLVGAVVLGCVYRLPIDRPRIRLTGPFLVLLAFVVYVWAEQTPDMIAGYVGDRGHLAGSLFAQLITGFGAIIAAAYVLRGRSPYPFLALGLASATFAAILAIVTTNNPAVGPPIAGLLDPSHIDQRGIGTFSNPNYFGLFEAIAMVTAAGWMIGTHSPRLRFVLLVTSAVLGVGLALSLSRGAVIAMPAGLACLAFASTRARTAGLFAAGLIVATLVLFPIFVDWRLSTTSGSDSANAYAALADSTEGRLSAVLAGPRLFLTSPVFGIGWGYYSTMSAEAAGPGVSLAAHNWYINVLAEEGAVGIVLWTLLLVALVIALRSRPKVPRSLGFGALGAYAVGSLFLEPPTSFQTSVLAILVIVAALTSDWSSPPVPARPPAGESPPPMTGARS
jgi:O-antigen ligase